VINGIDTRDVLRAAALLDAPPIAHLPPQPVPLDTDPHAQREFEQAVTAALEHLDGPALSKIVLSRAVTVPYPVDLTASYLLGRAATTTTRSFLTNYGGVKAAGFYAQPSTRVRDGRITAEPLAGTRARTGGGEDRLRVAELTANPTELYEHAVTLLAARDELAALCLPGSLVAKDILTVVARGSVYQLATRLEGKLRVDRNAFDALAGMFPAVTATGIPKTAAAELIADLEPPRGLYGGLVLATDLDTGDLDAALAHAALISTDTGAVMRTGVGIVPGCIAARKYTETSELLGGTARYLVPAATANAHAV
jgi:anthranilate/para-aminobenzoate synthase component I